MLVGNSLISFLNASSEENLTLKNLFLKFFNLILVIRDIAKETTSKEKELKKQKSQNEENEAFIADQNEELEKLQEKMHEYNESERNFTGIQTKITEAKNNLKHIKGQMNELKDSLGDDNIIDDEDQIEHEQETLANESQRYF